MGDSGRARLRRRRRGDGGRIGDGGEGGGDEGGDVGQLVSDAAVRVVVGGSEGGHGGQKVLHLLDMRYKKYSS